jgi:hypothetical protein
MNGFKTLSNAEKLTEIGKRNFRRGEVASIEEYMLALVDDNRAVIDEYESFGDHPRQIINNKAIISRPHPSMALRKNISMSMAGLTVLPSLIAKPLFLRRRRTS